MGQNGSLEEIEAAGLFCSLPHNAGSANPDNAPHNRREDPGVDNKHLQKVGPHHRLDPALQGKV